MSNDHLELVGKVIEVAHGTYKVLVNETHVVNAKLSGKLRINKIRVIPEDTVTVKVSPYDMNTGFIIRRGVPKTSAFST